MRKSRVLKQPRSENDADEANDDGDRSPLSHLDDETKRQGFARACKKRRKTKTKTTTTRNPSPSPPLDLCCGFKMGDLVWAKALPNSWSPGSIIGIDGSSASVSFFGRQRRRRFRSSELWGFEENYPKMSKLSGASLTAERRLALDYMRRRISAGLACACSELRSDEDYCSGGGWMEEVKKGFDPEGTLGFVLDVAVLAWVDDDTRIVSAARALACADAYRNHALIRRGDEMVYEKNADADEISAQHEEYEESEESYGLSREPQEDMPMEINEEECEVLIENVLEGEEICVLNTNDYSALDLFGDDIYLQNVSNSAPEGCLFEVEQESSPRTSPKSKGGCLLNTVSFSLLDLYGDSACQLDDHPQDVSCSDQSEDLDLFTSDCKEDSNLSTDASRHLLLRPSETDPASSNSQYIDPLVPTVDNLEPSYAQSSSDDIDLQKDMIAAHAHGNDIQENISELHPDSRLSLSKNVICSDASMDGVARDADFASPTESEVRENACCSASSLANPLLEEVRTATSTDVDFVGVSKGEDTERPDRVAVSAEHGAEDPLLPSASSSDASLVKTIVAVAEESGNVLPAFGPDCDEIPLHGPPANSSPSKASSSSRLPNGIPGKCSSPIGTKLPDALASGSEAAAHMGPTTRFKSSNEGEKDPFKGIELRPSDGLRINCHKAPGTADSTSSRCGTTPSMPPSKSNTRKEELHSGSPYWRRFYYSPLVKDDYVAHKGPREYDEPSTAAGFCTGSCGRSLHMKFLDLSKMPSKEELERKFGVVGPLDPSRTQVSPHRGTCTLVFLQRTLARAAYEVARKKRILGIQANACFWLSPCDCFARCHQGRGPATSPIPGGVASSPTVGPMDESVKDLMASPTPGYASSCPPGLKSCLKRSRSPFSEGPDHTKAQKVRFVMETN